LRKRPFFAPTGRRIVAAAPLGPKGPARQQLRKCMAAIQRQIEATDAEIDRLVYCLYGLTKDEIAIVEDATATR